MHLDVYLHCIGIELVPGRQPQLIFGLPAASGIQRASHLCFFVLEAVRRFLDFIY